MSRSLEVRWIVAVVVALAALGGVIAVGARWVRVSQPAPKMLSVHSAPALSVGALDGKSRQSLLAEQASLLLPEPLFLPTEFNTSQPQLPAVFRREPGSALPGFRPRYLFGDEAVDLVYVDPVESLARPVEVMSFGRTQNPFVALGRRDHPDSALTVRKAFLEVVHAGSGRVLLAQAISPPGTAVVASGLWVPLEMVVSVDDAGLVGEPAVTRSSGAESVDEEFRAFLAKGFRLGERLPAGFYILRIGP